MGDILSTLIFFPTCVGRDIDHFFPARDQSFPGYSSFTFYDPAAEGDRVDPGLYSISFVCFGDWFCTFQTE